jgi:serine protease Do
MLPPDPQGRRFFFDMHPPADRDFLFKRMDGHGRLGIGIQDLTPQLGEYFGTKDGILVTNVEADTPAAKAGLKAGDVITSINGKPVADPGQLIESVQSASDGAELTIGYLRDHKAGTAKATLTPREQPKAERRGEPI